MFVHGSTKLSKLYPKTCGKQMLDKSSSAMIEIPEGKLETTILTAITELAIAVLVEDCKGLLELAHLEARRGVELERF